MTPKQFNDALAKLRLSVYASAPVLGISLRQAQRYSSGEQSPVAAPVANSLTLLVEMVRDWKRQRKRIQEQLAFFERSGARISMNGKDETKEWIAKLQSDLAEYEDLLRNGGENGLPPQID